MSQRQVNAVRSRVTRSFLLTVGFWAAAQGLFIGFDAHATSSPGGAAAPVQRQDGPGGTRLVIGAVPVPVESGLALQSSDGLINAALADPNTHSEIAALWRIVAARPEDLLSDIRQVQRLEGELAQLRNERDTDQKLVSALRVKLDKANSGRELLMGVSFLLALAVAVVYAWPRHRRPAPHGAGRAPQPHRNRRPVSFTIGKAGATLISAEAIKIQRKLDIDFDSFGLGSPAITVPDSQKLESKAPPSPRR